MKARKRIEVIGFTLSALLLAPLAALHATGETRAADTIPSRPNGAKTEQGRAANCGYDEVGRMRDWMLDRHSAL